MKKIIALILCLNLITTTQLYANNLNNSIEVVQEQKVLQKEEVRKLIENDIDDYIKIVNLDTTSSKYSPYIKDSNKNKQQLEEDCYKLSKEYNSYNNSYLDYKGAKIHTHLDTYLMDLTGRSMSDKYLKSVNYNPNFNDEFLFIGRNVNKFSGTENKIELIKNKDELNKNVRKLLDIIDKVEEVKPNMIKGVDIYLSPYKINNIGGYNSTNWINGELNYNYIVIPVNGTESSDEKVISHEIGHLLELRASDEDKLLLNKYKGMLRCTDKIYSELLAESFSDIILGKKDNGVIQTLIKSVNFTPQNNYAISDYLLWYNNLYVNNIINKEEAKDVIEFIKWAKEIYSVEVINEKDRYVENLEEINNNGQYLIVIKDKYNKEINCKFSVI